MEPSPASYLEVIRLAIFGGDATRPFTQDSPILPKVWLAYAEDPWASHDLLLTPQRYANPGALVTAIREGARAFAEMDIPHDRQLTYNESYAVGRFTFAELVGVLLPLTPWYRSHVLRGESAVPPAGGDGPGSLLDALDQRPGTEPDKGPISADLVWLTRIVGLIELARTYRPVLTNPWADGAVRSPDTPPGRMVAAVLEAASNLYS